jgi:hypothetical protein
MPACADAETRTSAAIRMNLRMRSLLWFCQEIRPVDFAVM